ncbi:FeoA family protein [Ileibacterium valens]|uniref:FeoA family protein n=1 Tax=Ileibacterium valens TaxID=1862668 RepID=UPI0024B93AD7|nr:FeoA family protein [Ileibacterium valens]
MRLKDVPLSSTIKVVSIDLNEDTKRRLQSLGMLPGTPLQVLHRKKSGTMVISLRSNRFAIGSKMSAGIEVDHV